MTWMIAMVIASNASLSAVLLRPDQSVTADLVWPSRAECEVVRDAHLAVKPSPIISPRLPLRCNIIYLGLSDFNRHNLIVTLIHLFHQIQNC